MFINNIEFKNSSDFVIIYFDYSKPNFKLSTCKDGASHSYEVKAKRFRFVDFDRRFNSMGEVYEYFKLLNY